MFNPIGAASLMGVDMEYFVYLNLGCCVIGLFCIPIMKLTFAKLRKSGRLVVQEVQKGLSEFSLFLRTKRLIVTFK